MIKADGPVYLRGLLFLNDGNMAEDRKLADAYGAGAEEEGFFSSVGSFLMKEAKDVKETADTMIT